MTTENGAAPAHLVRFLEQHEIDAEFLAPGVPTPTVASAAEAIGVPPEQILKTLLFAGGEGQHVIAIAKGVKRISRDRLADACDVARPRPAKPDVVEAVTGYPAGGVAPVGLPPEITVVVDTAVAALPVAYGGGGREHLLLRISPADIIRINHAIVAPIMESD